ncbi:hypothetical protein MNB_SM-7-1125 [hydrothermal vent metagenome]|uniref:Lipoprotein n=1 Tax=hydrothermal vent metagenome TaxID=652676 RepID=A0A1W1BAG6_9ZZZZ
MFSKKVLTMVAVVPFLTACMAGKTPTPVKIDINKYDMISIYKNAPDSVEEGEKSGAKFINEGTNPYKILDDTALSCKELGFSKFTKENFDDFVRYHYTKMVKNDVEATCDENIYKNGSNNFSILVDGND